MTSFPALRMRRARAAAWSRALVAETVLTPADLIWPLFITDGSGVESPIATLPGVSRWSVDLVVKRAREAADAGIPCLAFFPNTPRELRSEDGREALNPDNLMCRAIRAVKDAVPEIGILTDVALDPYTSHAHDGLTDASGYVLNDETTEQLVLPGAGSGAGGRRHRRTVRHDGRPRRRDPHRARGRGPPQRPDHGLCGQICLRLLRPVPRCGRLAAGC